jgi:hypothetical protein
VEGVAAVGDDRTARCGASELDGSLDRLRAGIGKEDLLQVRNTLEQSFGKDARQRRDIHLDQIRKIVIEDGLEGIADARMVASQRKDALAAEEIEIALVVPVEQVGALRLAEADVVAERLQDPHHLTVQIARVQPVALGFALGIERRKIEGHVYILVDLGSIRCHRPLQAVAVRT